MNYLLLDPKDILGDRAVVTKDYQLKHLAQVLKVDEGRQIRIAQKGGLLGTAQLESLSAHEAKLSNVMLDTKPPEKLPITLVVAMPRPKALRRLISDVVAMGVQALYIIHSYRVEKSYWQTPFLEKLDDYVQLGLEQAGDSIAPRIHLKKRFKPFVEDELSDIIAGKIALVAHPDKQTDVQYEFGIEPQHMETKKREVVLVVGAEGGFIPYEVDLLKTQGCRQVSLGRRILRTETAISVLVGKLSNSIY